MCIYGSQIHLHQKPAFRVKTAFQILIQAVGPLILRVLILGPFLKHFLFNFGSILEAILMYIFLHYWLHFWFQFWVKFGSILRPILDPKNVQNEETWHLKVAQQASTNEHQHFSKCVKTAVVLCQDTLSTSQGSNKSSTNCPKTLQRSLPDTLQKKGSSFDPPFTQKHLQNVP